LVTEWRENFLDLQSLSKEEAFKRIVSAVNVVGKKTAHQCKNKIKNLKELYKKAKHSNKRSGQSLRTFPYFDIFDEVLGGRDIVTMSHLAQVGVASAIKGKSFLSFIEEQF